MKKLFVFSLSLAAALGVAQASYAASITGTKGLAAPAAVGPAVIVGTEDPTTGFVGPFPPPFNDQGQVGSDGEGFFDPFGFGADTSDGIKFNSDSTGGPWVADANIGKGWVQLPVTAANPNTWVLPADLTGIGCGVENATTCDPVGVWDLPGSFWVPEALGTYVILGDGGTVSDILTASNTAPGGFAQLTFQSSPIPEPASLALLGSGLVAFGVFRRRRQEKI